MSLKNVKLLFSYFVFKAGWKTFLKRLFSKLYEQQAASLQTREVCFTKAYCDFQPTLWDSRKTTIVIWVWNLWIMIWVVIYSLLIVTHFVGWCNCSMFCCALLCVHPSFEIISMGKRELVALLVFLVSHDCYMALPHDTMGLSAVCDCGISWSYSLTI